MFGDTCTLKILFSPSLFIVSPIRLFLDSAWSQGSPYSAWCLTFQFNRALGSVVSSCSPGNVELVLLALPRYLRRDGKGMSTGSKHISTVGNVNVACPVSHRASALCLRGENTEGLGTGVLCRIKTTYFEVSGSCQEPGLPALVYHFPW